MESVKSIALLVSSTLKATVINVVLSARLVLAGRLNVNNAIQKKSLYTAKLCCQILGGDVSTSASLVNSILAKYVKLAHKTVTLAQVAQTTVQVASQVTIRIIINYLCIILKVSVRKDALGLTSKTTNCTNAHQDPYQKRT